MKATKRLKILSTMKSYHLCLGILLLSVLVRAQYRIEEYDKCENYGCEECPCPEDVPEYDDVGREVEKISEREEKIVGEKEVVGVEDREKGRRDSGSMNVSGFEEALKVKMLKMHNEFRRNVSQGKVPNQPRTDRLRDLVWNEDLAKMAKETSQVCLYGETSGYLRDGLGQNLEYQRTVEEAFKVWTEGSSLYNYKLNHCNDKCGSNKKPNHCLALCRNYKQLVSELAKYVGCGATKCQNQGYYLVCNYAIGDVLEERPY